MPVLRRADDGTGVTAGADAMDALDALMRALDAEVEDAVELLVFLPPEVRSRRRISPPTSRTHLAGTRNSSTVWSSLVGQEQDKILV